MTKNGNLIGHRRVVLAYEILFLFFGNGIVHSDVMNDIFQYFPVLDDVHIDNKTSSTEIQWFIFFQLVFKICKLLNLAKSGCFILLMETIYLDTFVPIVGNIVLTCFCFPNNINNSLFIQFQNYKSIIVNCGIFSTKPGWNSRTTMKILLRFLQEFS